MERVEMCQRMLSFSSRRNSTPAAIHGSVRRQNFQGAMCWICVARFVELTPRTNAFRSPWFVATIAMYYVTYYDHEKVMSW